MRIRATGTNYGATSTHYVNLGGYLRFCPLPRGAEGENLVIYESFRRRFFG